MTLYWCSDSQIAYPIGYAATSRMMISDGDSIAAASRRSESPERRRSRGRAIVACAVATIVLERMQCRVDLALRLRQGGLRRGAARQRRVDVLIDRFADLRIHRRDRT